MTQSEYVAHSGLTKGRVSQLVKAGMPLTSKEAADAWRGMSAKSRAASPIIPKSVSGTPINPGPYRPQEASAPINPQAFASDNPSGAYERQREIERHAYRLVVDSLNGGRPDAGRLVQIHAQAAKNLVSAREEVLALAERERSLVSGDWVRKVMTEHDGEVAALLRAMPKQLAGRIAPHDPEHAEKELHRWVQEVALATLQKTDPWRC